jgi:hypothetical protein
MYSAAKCCTVVFLGLVWTSTGWNAEPQTAISTSGKVNSVTATKPDVEKDTTVGIIMLEGTPTPIRVKIGTKICVGSTSDLVGRSIGSIKKGQEIEVEGIVQGGELIATQILIRTEKR